MSAGAVGAALGILGYFLGMWRLGAATIVFGVVAVFIVAATSAGLIAGVEPFGHGYGYSEWLKVNSSATRAVSSQLFRD